MRRRHATSGFTLLEVLVAVGLLAFVSLLMVQAIRLSFRAREEISRVEELNHGARVALRRMASDISMAYLSNHVNPEEPTTATIFDGREDRLLFSYLGHERRRRGSRESDQGIVEYRLERSDEGRILVRREKSTPDAEPDRGGVRETLVAGVKDFRLAYWDEKDEDWKNEWEAVMEDALRSGTAGSLSPVLAPAGSAMMKAAQDKMLEGFQLPSRVYVRLVLLDADGNEFPFETQARIHLRLPMNF